MRNDLGEIDMYMAEWFNKSSKGKKKNLYIEIEAFVDRSSSIEVKNRINLKEFIKMIKTYDRECNIINTNNFCVLYRMKRCK